MLFRGSKNPRGKCKFRTKCCYQSDIGTKPVQQWRSFLGATDYYKTYITDYSKVASPLYELLKKDIFFKSSTLCEHAFEKLKHCLISTPILRHVAVNDQFSITKSYKTFLYTGANVAVHISHYKNDQT